MPKGSTVPVLKLIVSSLKCHFKDCTFNSNSTDKNLTSNLSLNTF